MDICSPFGVFVIRLVVISIGDEPLPIQSGAQTLSFFSDVLSVGRYGEAQHDDRAASLPALSPGKNSTVRKQWGFQTTLKDNRAARI